jgi:hypothetical protein
MDRSVDERSGSEDHHMKLALEILAGWAQRGVIMLITTGLLLAALVIAATWPLGLRTNKQSKTREVRRRPF